MLNLAYMALDLFCFVGLGILLGSLFLHYLAYATHTELYSYKQLLITIISMFVLIWLSSNIDGGWNRNLVTEFVPLFVLVLTTVVYVVCKRRSK